MWVMFNDIVLLSADYYFFRLFCSCLHLWVYSGLNQSNCLGKTSTHLLENDFYFCKMSRNQIVSSLEASSKFSTRSEKKFSQINFVQSVTNISQYNLYICCCISDNAGSGSKLLTISQNHQSYNLTNNIYYNFCFTLSEKTWKYPRTIAVNRGGRHMLALPILPCAMCAACIYSSHGEDQFPFLPIVTNSQGALNFNKKM